MDVNNNILDIPSISCLAKLGSIIVHLEEALSDRLHPFDIESIKSLINDSEVKNLIKELDALALVPKKR